MQMAIPNWSGGTGALSDPSEWLQSPAPPGGYAGTLTVNGNGLLTTFGISGFAQDEAAGTSDTIDLLGAAATSAIILGDAIIVANGASPVMTLLAAGLNPEDKLIVTDDGNGGSFVRYGGPEGIRTMMLPGSLPRGNISPIKRLSWHM